jgi:polysaccharide biosynthesis transport protein
MSKMSADHSLFSRPEFTVRSLVRSAWKHSFLVLVIAAAVTSAGVAIVARVPAIYRAEALILVDPQKVPERFVSSTVNVDAQERLATISQEILSSTRLQGIIDEFNLYPQQRKFLAREEIIDAMRKNDLTIRLEKGVGSTSPGAFRVIYQGPDPVVVAKVVNRITDLYIDENLRTREVRAAGTSDFIHIELQEAKRKLDELEAAVSQYKLQHNGQLPQQENSLIAILENLKVELQGNQDATNHAQQEQAVLKSALDSAEATEAALKQQALAGPPADTELGVASNDVPLSKLQRDYNELQDQLAQARLRYSDDHPDVRRLRLSIASLQPLVREEAARRVAAAAKPALQSARTRLPLDPVAAERARTQDRVGSLKDQARATERELQTRKVERERILRDLAAYQQRLEALPVREQEMARLTRDYEFSKAYYNSLLSKRTEAEMATDLEKRQKAETFRVLDTAKPPTKPFKPNREMLSLLGAALGLGLGLAAAVGLELKAGVVLGEWELPAGVAVVGRVPHIDPSLAASAGTDSSSGRRRRAGVTKRLAILSSGAVLLLAMIRWLAFLFTGSRDV